MEAFHGTYAQLIAFYLAARLYIAAVHALMAIVIPKVRNIMLLNIVTILIPAAFWIGSIFVEGEGRKQGLIWVGIVWGRKPELGNSVKVTDSPLTQTFSVT